MSKIITHEILGVTPAYVKELSPKNFSFEDVYEYFQYIFNFFLGLYIHEENYLPKEFEKFQQEIAGENLTPPAIWWILVALTLKEVVRHKDSPFLGEQINSVLQAIPYSKEKDVIRWVNRLNFATFLQHDEILHVRPLEASNLKSDMYKEDLLLFFLVERKDWFVNFYLENFQEKDINLKKVRQLLFSSLAVERKFTSFWHTFYELFCLYIFSEIDIHKLRVMPNLSQRNILKQLKKSIYSFAQELIANKEKRADFVEDHAKKVCNMVLEVRDINSKRKKK